MLKKSIIAIIGGSVLILVLLMVFEPIQAYAALGPIDDFPIYWDSSHVQHNGQAVHYYHLQALEPRQLEDFYINALAKRNWQLQLPSNNQSTVSMYFNHAILSGLVEITITHHDGGCQPAWHEVYARYVDPRLPPKAPTINVRWHANRFGCGGA